MLTPGSALVSGLMPAAGAAGGVPGEGGVRAAVCASVASHMGSGVPVIEAEAGIRRSAERVFGYASDPANEPGWHIRLRRVEMLTGGPAGVGARYRMEFTQGPAAISGCGRFERPGYWGLAGGRRSSIPAPVGATKPATAWPGASPISGAHTTTRPGRPGAADGLPPRAR